MIQQQQSPPPHMLRSNRRRRRRQRRRQSDDSMEYDPTDTPIPLSTETTATAMADMVTTSLSQLLADRQPRVVVLFFYDPHQPHSLQVRHRLGQVAAEDILVCAMILVNKGSKGRRDERNSHNPTTTTTPSPLPIPDQEFLQSTGMVATHIDASSLAWHTMFRPRVQAYPHLILVRTDTGQSFGTRHEELALEWNNQVGNNSFSQVQDRWRQYQSGLNPCQQLMAQVLFPTACIIL